MFTIKFSVDSQRVKNHWVSKYKQEDLAPEVSAQTELFRKSVEQKWGKREMEVLSLIEKFTGLDIAGHFSVFILPPELEMAQYIDEENIEWGYGELYPNSIVVGLAHELIHCLTHDFYSTLSDDDKWIFHALIYLSADEELRFTLNGRAEYFTSPVLDTYHERLIETAKRILPFWKEYLSNPKGENIINLFEKIKDNT